MAAKCLDDYENKGTRELVIRHEFVKIYSNALLELNDADALEAAKRFYQLLKSKQCDVYDRKAAAFFCLAIEQVMFYVNNQQNDCCREKSEVINQCNDSSLNLT